MLVPSPRTPACPTPLTPVPRFDFDSPYTPKLTAVVPVASPYTPRPSADRPQTPLVLPVSAIPNTPLPVCAFDCPHTPAVDPPAPPYKTTPISALAVPTASL